MKLIGSRSRTRVLWEAIRLGCERGCHAMDFGRSGPTDHGLRAFKSGWGAVERPLVYTTIVGPPRGAASSAAPDVLRGLLRGPALGLSRRRRNPLPLRGLNRPSQALPRRSSHCVRRPAHPPLATRRRRRRPPAGARAALSRSAGTRRAPFGETLVKPSRPQTEHGRGA